MKTVKTFLVFIAAAVILLPNGSNVFAEDEEPYEEPTEYSVDWEESSYEEPDPQYEDPEPYYEEPEYEDPDPEYEDPEPEYEDPEPEYEDPEPEYEDPEPEYEDPEPEYEESEPEYEDPESSYYEEPSEEEPESYIEDESEEYSEEEESVEESSEPEKIIVPVTDPFRSVGKMKYILPVDDPSFVSPESRAEEEKKAQSSAEAAAVINPDSKLLDSPPMPSYEPSVALPYYQEDDSSSVLMGMIFWSIIGIVVTAILIMILNFKGDSSDYSFNRKRYYKQQNKVLNTRYRQ